jgi:hypothetical protein
MARSRSIHAVKFDRGIENVQQWQAPYIADKDITRSSHQRYRLLQHTLQIFNVGKVLNHGIKDNRVEVTGVESVVVLLPLLRRQLQD